MPIELWWWVEPLFETGFLTLVTLTVAGLLLDQVIPHSPIPMVIACAGILPWVICVLAFFGWLITNVLILIWRC